MNKESWNFAEKLVPTNYVRQAANATVSKENLIRQLIQHKLVGTISQLRCFCISFRRWTAIILIQIMVLANVKVELLQFHLRVTLCIFIFLIYSVVSYEIFNKELAHFFPQESYELVDLVAKRHYYLGHGIGRSGDLNEPQPKAAGSSLLYALTNCMFKDLMKLMGIVTPVECMVVPVATGMALVLCMLSFRSSRPKAKYVIWLRIDQKSCFKSIITAGFEPIIIDLVQSNDKLISGTQKVASSIEELGSSSIACVMTTTSCFAPRTCDDIQRIGAICKKYDVPHLINNAYGLQSRNIMKKIQVAETKGRVDAFVQSTDKNIMVPVGGAIIASFNPKILKEISKTYPGRASSTPIIDSFITLLHLGKSGYCKLVYERESMLDYLRKGLLDVANKCGEKLLETSENDISVAMTLSSISKQDLTQVGSMLFWRNISGSRIVTTLETKKINGYEFKGWGSHSNCYLNNTPYITAAAAIGISKDDIDAYISKLRKVLERLQKVDPEVRENL